MFRDTTSRGRRHIHPSASSGCPSSCGPGRPSGVSSAHLSKASSGGTFLECPRSTPGPPASPPRRSPLGVVLV
eukprot:3059233-Heterocapsa_arctica.AAC.1